MKSLEDYLVCDKCGQPMYEFSTDEIEFTSDYHKGNIGHYYVDVHCPHCRKDKRAYIAFKYEITDYYVRG